MGLPLANAQDCRRLRFFEAALKVVVLEVGIAEAWIIRNVRLFGGSAAQSWSVLNTKTPQRFYTHTEGSM
jgi:hypothetical protein